LLYINNTLLYINNTLLYIKSILIEYLNCYQKKITIFIA